LAVSRFPAWFSPAAGNANRWAAKASSLRWRDTMNTGYYIQNNYIYGPTMPGQFYIQDGYIYGPKNNGLYYIQNNYIYGSKESGKFYIQDGYIYGPTQDLPWMAD